MRKFYCFISFLLLFANNTLLAQQTIRVSFENARDTISRKETEFSYGVTIKADSVKIAQKSLKNYTLSIKVDEIKSTLPKSNYQLHYNSATLDKVKSPYSFFITFKADIEPDGDRILYLNLNLTSDSTNGQPNSAKVNTTLELVVRGYSALNRFNYLGFIGTNFDLVDGVQAKNVFFATSIFSAPKLSKQGIGFNLTLYGNRTLTQTDTSGRTTFTSKIVGLNGDSARFYTEEALKTTSRVTDNLGATFSPLIRIGKTSDPERQLQLYYAPQFEFIWRRTKITTTLTDKILIDSVDRANRPISGTLQITPEKETIALNVYDVYFGLAGILLKHENENICVRMQTSVGINFSYTAIKGGLVRGNGIINNPVFDRQVNPFFYTRAWIIEPKSGLTFGAEVSNFFAGSNYQPYYNVTLSKAINLSALGTIFQPINTIPGSTAKP